MSNEIVVAAIGASAALLSTLMGFLFNRVQKVHKLVNSAASAASEEIHAQAKEVADLKELVLVLQQKLTPPQIEVMRETVKKADQSTP